MVHSISPQPPGDTTPGPMTPEREQEIRTREQAATPGPWESDGAEIYGTLGGVLMLDLWVGETLDIDNQEQSNADAAFIAAAREAVPELLAEVADLRARVAELEAARNCASQMTTSLGTSRCSLPARHSGDHRNAAKNHYWDDEYEDATEVHPPHPAPCRHPASPDCTCPDPEIAAIDGGIAALRNSSEATS